MATTIHRGGGFFVVRGNTAQRVGREWPDGATMAYAKNRVALLFDDRVQVLDAASYSELMDASVDAINGRHAKSAAVARMVGKYGGANLFEIGSEVVGEGATPRWGVDEPALRANAKTLHLPLKKAGKGRFIEGFASTPEIDRENDVVEPTAFNESLPAFMATNPMMLWNHDSYQPAGHVVAFEVRKDGLWIRGNITNDFVWEQIDRGTLRTLSVQFVPDLEAMSIEEVPTGRKVPARRQRGPTGMLDLDEDDGQEMVDEMRRIRRFRKAELIEVSVVAIPCNRTATFTLAKSMQHGTDLVCAVCRSSVTSCECAEVRAVVDYRPCRVAGAGPVDLGHDAMVKAIGRDGARQALLLDRPGVAPLKHHGIQDGELVMVPGALRAAMAALVAYSDLGREPMTEAERRAAHYHLAKHYEELGETPPALGKGPAPERTAAIVGTMGLEFFKADGFDTAMKAATWCVAHGFTCNIKEHADRFTTGGVTEVADTYPLDKGVCAVLYRTPEKEIAPMTKTVQPEPAVAPAAPGSAAPPSPPAPAAPPAVDPAPSEAEDLVEIEIADLAALELAQNGGGSGLTHEALEHALTETVETIPTE